MPPVEFIDLGSLDYRAAHGRQIAVVEERKEERGADTLFFVEHPHVITLGRRKSSRENILQGRDKRAFASSVAVVQSERGGDATYHGPGQLVAYPVLKLGTGERDLHKFLRNLEQAVIDTLAEFHLDSGRESGKTGVWRQGRKLASIGIACRKWVTFHGLALNVSTDLSYFHRLNPCGFSSALMTSMERELKERVAMDAVKASLRQTLGTHLQRAF